jgi:glycosyltransferase involved in cell wall biosynthesis
MDDRGTKSEPPLVSVIVPTYARPTLLQNALKSVNAQTYSLLEIVVVDDNGRGTPLQLETQRTVDSMSFREGIVLSYVVREKNGGGAMARNSGIEAARGAYVAFLDDDDEWMPEKLEKQVAAMENHEEVGLSYAHCKAELGDGSEVFYRRTVNGNARFEQAICGCIAATSQWVARRDALLSVGSFSDSPSKQDSILLYKLLLAGYEVRCVPEVLSIYDQHSQDRISTSGKSLIGERNYSELIRSTYDRFTKGQRRQIEAAIRYRLGRVLWLGDNRREGALQLVSSLAISPLHFLQRAFGSEYTREAPADYGQRPAAGSSRDVRGGSHA